VPKTCFIFPIVHPIETEKQRREKIDAGESKIWMVECGRMTFLDVVAVWSAQWWRVEGVMALFSLAEEEKQG